MVLADSNLEDQSSLHLFAYCPLPAGSVKLRVSSKSYPSLLSRQLQVATEIVPMVQWTLSALFQLLRFPFERINTLGRFVTFQLFLVELPCL